MVVILKTIRLDFNITILLILILYIIHLKIVFVLLQMYTPKLLFFFHNLMNFPIKIIKVIAPLNKSWNYLIFVRMILAKSLHGNMPLLQ